MKHLFLNKELSLLAKRKGFNEPCFARYNGNDFQLIAATCYWNSYPSVYPNDINGTDIKAGDPVIFSAPLHQQVLDWLREEHDIYIEVIHWTSQLVGNEVWKDCYQNFINGDAVDVSIFRTYYESLNRAIEEALKVIS